MISGARWVSLVHWHPLHRPGYDPDLSRGAYNTSPEETWKRTSVTVWRSVGLRIASLTMQRIVQTGQRFLEDYHPKPTKYKWANSMGHSAETVLALAVSFTQPGKIGRIVYYELPRKQKLSWSEPLQTIWGAYYRRPFYCASPVEIFKFRCSLRRS